MEQNSKADRLHALDGLRGFAIILVFLSHINATFVNRATFFGGTIFDSGVLGVTFLFVLSGFLMAYLYPQPKNAFAFIQKRYTRIFPLFLAITTGLFLVPFFPNHPWIIPVGVVLITAGITNLLWVYVIKKYFNKTQATLLFFAFVLLQIIVAVYYFWVTTHPPIFYYSQMPESTRTLLDWMVNMTLTLSIGKYTNMIDPVYWSLAAEVLFYLLYPFICAPIIAFMSTKSRTSRILLLLVLLPFFAGVAILARQVLNLNLLRFHLFYYFVTGMSLGYVYRKYPESIARLSKFFPPVISYLTLILFFGFIFFARALFIHYLATGNWIQLFLAIPLTLLVTISLIKTTALAKFFRSKILVYLGTISYSIYLSHMFVLNSVIAITKQPDSILTTILYIFLTFAFTVIFSSILYFLLEKPYFKRAPAEEKKTKTFSYATHKSVPWLWGGIPLGLLFIIFFVYQSNVTFFTYREPFNSSLISPRTNDELVSFKQSPAVTMQFTSTHDNFGVLSLQLLHRSIPHKKFAPQHITFRIKEKGEKNWYATSDYYLNHPKDDLPQSFGFPLIANASGKTYIVSLTEENPTSSEYVLLNNGKNAIAGIFFVDKKILLKHPDQLFLFTQNKLLTVATTDEAQQILQLITPFMLLSLFFLFQYLFLNRTSRQMV